MTKPTFTDRIGPEGETQLVYKFGDASYRTTEPNVLEGQLLFAKPSRERRLGEQLADSDRRLDAR
jgi:hypothetical protein